MKRTKPRHPSLLITASLVVSAFTNQALLAQSGSWTGGGNQSFPDCIWGGPANWLNNTIPSGANNTATFGQVFTNGYATTKNVARTLGHVVYNDPQNAFDFILRRSANQVTLTLSTTTGQPTLSVNQADRMFVMDVLIAGTNGFAKNGPGKLVLSNSGSTYTGPIAINAGTLEIGGGQYTFFRGPVATRGPLEATLNVGTAGRVGNGNYAGPLTIAENALLFYNSTSDTILTGNISGAGGLHKGRSSLLTLSGANTYSGGTTSFGGMLLAVSPGSLPEYATPGKVVFDGGTIGVRMGGSDWTTAQADTLLANATRTSGALGIDTTNGGLSQWTAFTTTNLGPALGLTKLGDNTLTLNLANNYNGVTTVRLGTLLLASTGTLGSGANALNLEGGTLDLGGLGVTVGDVSITRAAANGSILANGSLTGASYAVSNTTGNAVVSANLLANGTIGLTKTGAGTLTLAGANTYTGDTLAQAGAVLGASGGSSSSNVVVSESAAFGAAVTATNGQWVNSGNLAFANSSTLRIVYGSTPPSKTVAPIRVQDLTLGAGLTLNIPSDSLALLEIGETYPLITWTGSGPIDATSITTFLAYRVSGTPSVTGNTLFMTINSSAPGPISWNFDDGVWDQATQNWRDSASNPTTYFDTLDEVVFGNVATVAENEPIIVTLSSAFSPTGMTVNSADHDYTVTGTGSISGSGSLTVNLPSTRTFTLGMANSYTGGTSILGGTLLMTNNLSLGGNNSVITVADGAALNFNGAKAGSSDYHAFITGSGVNGTGAIINQTTDRLSGLGKLTLLGDSTVSSTARWDVRPIAAGNGLVDLGGFTLTKIGSAQLSIVDGVMTNPGSIIVNQGTLGLTRNVISGAGSINVNNGATLFFENNTTGSFNKAINVNGSILRVSGAAVTTAAPVALAGNSSFQNVTSLTLDGALSGSGSLVKSEIGILTINSESTYAGAVTVSVGQLKLGATGSINDSESVTLGAGAVFNTVDQATHVIPSGQPITFVINPAGSGTSGQIQAAGLDISSAAVSFNLLGALDDPAYVLATYTSLSGSPFASVTPPPGYAVNYSYEGNKIALVVSAGDYGAWASKFPLADLSDPNADYDGDGMTNDQERIFGLNPTTPSSVNPIVVPLNSAAGTLSFTRRDTALTGLDYSVWTSINLATWTLDGGATLTPGSMVDEVETVAVQLSAALLSQPKLFVRIGAAAPPPLFSEDFEGEVDGFTVSTTSGTNWERGVPNSPSQGGGAATSANSGTKCWATNLIGGYAANTDTSLRSPIINLTGVSSANLSFALSIDAPAGHTLEVSVIGADNTTVIANVLPPTGDVDPNTSPWQTIGPVALPAGALGQPVRFQWRFIGNGDGFYNGAYIDDVLLTE